MVNPKKELRSLREDIKFLNDWVELQRELC